jgi:hypothetical protein
MAGFCTRLRQLATRAVLVAVMGFALVPSADAQWFPFGAAPPGEIVQRLQAEGYILLRPLERRDTVYLADVAGGPSGRERLVIDAWSGEILQRFAARRRGFVPEGGEFSEPPPLGPPPERDFREGNHDYGPAGPGGYESPPRARGKSRPVATARKGGEPKQTAPQPAAPQNAGTGSPAAATAPTGAAAPATAASPPANPNPTEPAKAETSPANVSSEPAKEAQPKPNAAASSPAADVTQAKDAASPAPANRPSTRAEKPGEKKVNDVPVNPLD